jgi:hypothetical protein
MGNREVKIVGLCQVNDIIPTIYSVNNMVDHIQEPERFKEIYDNNNNSVAVPSVEKMQQLILLKRPRKKWYPLYNMRKYLLFSSLFNRGVGCGGTSPLIAPFMVYLVDESGKKSGGIFQEIHVAYNTLKELIRSYFYEKEEREPLLVITPDLNRKILVRQLLYRKNALDLKIEIMVGSYPISDRLQEEALICGT